MYKLLIVDDEYWSRRLICEVLDWNLLGVKTIDEAENGLEAIKKLEHTTYDLMIMDMRMPTMDGIELLKKLEGQIKPEIIIMSGYDDFEYMKQALKAQVLDYLLKPIVRFELEHAVKKAIALIQQRKVEFHLLDLALDLENHHDFMSYLSLKSQLYGEIINKNEAFVLKVLENIQQLILKNQTHVLLIKYIESDLEFMLEDLKKTHVSSLQMSAFNSQETYDTKIAYMESHLLILMRLMHQSQTKSKLYIEKVIAYIDLHFTKQITLENLAQLFFISKEHLARQFKQHTQKTLTLYINEKRIDYAKQLMITRKLSPKTAAAMSGFIHLHYFYKLFKIHTGLTPISYINMHNINIV